MRILEFRATRLHGYLNFNLAFHPDITFLTGINGSGKTTVVNTIAALVAPNLRRLASTAFEAAEVVIDDEGQINTISASRTADGLFLHTTATTEKLSIPTIDDELAFSSRGEAEFYTEYAAQQGSHEVLVFLKSLPTPMFLGIDRRSEVALIKPAGAGSLLRQAQHALYARRSNVFASVAQSLDEAAFFAENRFNEIQNQIRELTDLLRTHLIEAALRFDVPQTLANRGRPIPPNQLANIERTFRELGLPEETVGGPFKDFAERYNKIIAQLSQQDAHVDFDNLNAVDEPTREAAIQYLIQRPQFEQIVRIAKHVNKHAAQLQTVNRPLREYLGIVNQFFRDSDKAIGFARTGRLEVRLSEGGIAPVTALSSGESQLVVILTHLAFNPAAEKANVFVIDEPELSLHIRWQEMFVDAIRSINPNVQAILATHSPAIILEEIEHCIDLSPAVNN